MEFASPESLPSEDWISQPRSSAQTSLKGDTSLVEISSNASQSRIPLYKRSTSNPSRLGSKNPHPSWPRIIDNQEQLLTDRTGSSVKDRDQRRNSSLKGEKISDGSKNLRLSSGQTCTGYRSIQGGTVQHKIGQASAGNEGRQVTPEWKRRVLAGGNLSGQQQDLFSPIGLQEVFKTRATPHHSQKAAPQKKSRYYESARSVEYPSSPPPYPSPVSNSPAGASKNLQSQGNSTASIATKILVRPSLTLPESTCASIQAASLGDGKQLSMDKGRVVSSESVSRNESISIVQVTNGKISYEPTSKSSSLQRAPFRKYAYEEVNRPASSASDEIVAYSYGSTYSRLADDVFPDLTSQSLPEGLSVDTEVFASKGGFINFRRRGLPIDDSFQKRPLSPSSFQPSEALTPDSVPSYMERKMAPTVAHFPRDVVSSNHGIKETGKYSLVTTPSKPLHDENDAAALPRSSGSPLKLFDKYDTFTNDRLVRRLSQFERIVPTSSSSISQEGSGKNSPSPHKSQSTKQQRLGKANILQERRISNFGDGGLDRFNFTPSQIINESCALPALSLDVEQRGSKIVTSPPGLLKNSEMYVNARVMSEATFERVHRESENLSKPSKAENQRQSTERKPSDSLGNSLQEDGTQKSRSSLAGSKNFVSQMIQDSVNMEGKRFLPSPTRNPNPKRRRTIADIVEPSPTEANVEVEMQTPKIQSVVGRKRKDARYEVSSQIADPKVIATRPMLRPRTPTLSQTRTARLPAISTDPVQLNNMANTDLQKEKLHTESGLPILDAPVHALAGELAHFAIDIAQDITYGNRKTSVTTADFTTAANLIMQNIRAQARPRSGRISDEISATDQLQNIDESVTEGSTHEQFSRPPSREGGGILRRSRDIKQLDPRVIDHLRRYEDEDETGIALRSSLSSLKIVKDKSLPKSPSMESDPPNIRILNKPSNQDSEEDETLSWKNSILSRPQQQQSRRSLPSSGPSTRRSIPTSSSSISRNKAVIVPENIPHLLSDHVGGMTFDRAKQIWIRRRISRSNNANHQEVFGSDMTDDPLKEIPDLSVDELEEMKRVNIASQGSHPTSIRANGKGMIVTPMTDLNSKLDRTPQNDIAQPLHSREVPAAYASLPPYHSDSASCASKTEPQVVPLTGQKISHDDRGTNTTSQSEPTEKQNDLDSVEHEISILDGRSPKTFQQSHRRYRQPRAVTVAFSSPLVEHLYHSQPQVYSYDGGVSEEDSDLDLGESPGRVILTKECSTSGKSAPGRGPWAGYRKQRSISMASRDFIKRPVSRIDEHDELSIMAKSGLHRSQSINIVLTTPQSCRHARGTTSVPPPTSGLQSSLTFHLSPLSDFTLNQRDEYPRHEEALRKRRHGTRVSNDADGLYAVTIRNLVAKITDVEPYEPYWEYIRKLDLRSKGLATLYMLDDFCARIEELDVSENKLGQLNGVPASIRVLKITHNCLSSVTAWANLRNLQYLDVSCNQIQNLQGFQSLVHLRELKADNNEIGSLDGIAGLNGLLTLRLRNNALKYLDFEGFDLYMRSTP